MHCSYIIFIRLHIHFQKAARNMYTHITTSNDQYELTPKFEQHYNELRQKNDAIK
jgi:hypothetical protein